MKSSQNRPEFLSRTPDEKRHDHMAWLVTGIFVLGGYSIFAAYDHSQMDGIVTETMVWQPAHAAYDQTKAGVHDLAQWVVERTD